MARMDYTEINIDQRFHRHLIGKNGANSKFKPFLTVETETLVSLGCLDRSRAHSTDRKVMFE